MPVFFKGKEHIADYKLLYIPVFLFDKINLSRSIFFTGSELLGKEYLQIETEDSFYKKKEKYSLIIPESLSLNKRLLDENYDLFNVILVNYTFISERLREALVKEGITGVSYYSPKLPFSPEINFY